MKRFILLLTVATSAIAQTNTISITAQRNISATPDQVVFNVTVRTDPGAGVAEAVALLTGTNLTATDLQYVSSEGAGGRTLALDWTFQLTTSFSKMKDTTVLLSKLKQQLGSSNGAPVLSFSVSSAQTSDAAQSLACPLNALVSDARREADRLASAAGVHVGAIVGLSDYADIPVAAARLGNLAVTIFDPISVRVPYPWFSTSALFGYFSPSPLPATCALVVQFSLLP